MILHVHRQGPGTAEPLDLPILEHAQQLDLHVGWQVADLVEKDRRAIRQFEPADLLRQRAGEGALLPAEQLALDERARNRRAVDAHHDAAAPRALLVNLRRDEFLAGTRFAEEQHRRVSGRDLARLFEHALDGVTLSDDEAPAKTLVNLLAEVLILRLQLVTGAHWPKDVDRRRRGLIAASLA